MITLKINEAILGYDTITGEKLDLVTRTIGIIPVFDDIYKRSGSCTCRWN